MPIRTHERLKNVYGDATVDASTVRRWFRRFKEAEGQTRLADEKRSGKAGRRLLFTGLEYMPLLKGRPKRWKRTEIILKSDKVIVTVVVCKLCNCIWVFLKSKWEKNRRHYLLTDPRIFIVFWTSYYNPVLDEKKFQIIWNKFPKYALLNSCSNISIFENPDSDFLSPWIHKELAF